jgi:hypothetical protein
LDRVKWIFGNLVFTEAEKDSLIYAFKRTDIVFPDDFWKEVAEIKPPKPRTVKAPRNCSVREVPIAISKPERKVFGDPRNDPNYAPRLDQAQFVRARARVNAFINAGGLR